MTLIEQGILNMLLTDKAPKEIANIMKLNYDNFLYHQKKLYRKLGVQSRVQLIVKYSPASSYWGIAP